jgi:hypothetical protein
VADEAGHAVIANELGAKVRSVSIAVARYFQRPILQ